jgi:hypothetical protein
MTIHFFFVLKWLIPELKGLSRSNIESMVEIARQSSIPRIRKYGGYSFAASFFTPPIFFIAIFTKLNLIFGKVHFIFYGLAILFSTLSVFLLTSIFYSLILKPAIHAQLNKKSRCPQPSD